MLTNQHRCIKLAKKSNSIQLVTQIIKSWVYKTYRIQSDNNIQMTHLNKSQEKQRFNIINSVTQHFQIQKNSIKITQMINVEPILIQKSHLMKFSLINIIQKIPVVFIQKIVLYTILKKLMWTISEAQFQTDFHDKQQQKVMINQRQIQVSDKINYVVYSLSRQIKYIYQIICLKDSEYWNQKFNFDLLCMLITKIITNFIQENIKEILIQKKLMSEIYIIVIHVFLGIDVSSETYSIIAKKFVKKQDYKVKTTKKLKLKPIESLELTSRKILNDQSHIPSGQNLKRMLSSKLSNFQNKKVGIANSEKKQKRLVTKDSYQQNLNFKKLKSEILFNQIQEKSDKRQFITNLKENLHVEPLPPVVKIKMNINQIDKKQQIVNKKLFKDFDFEDKKKHIKSNQLSLSMNAYLKKYGQSINFRNSQVDSIKNQCKNNSNLKSNYLPIKSINLKMKSQKSSAHYYLSHNNSFQKKQNQKKQRELESERLSSQKKRQKQINTQKISLQKKKKNVNQWYKIIEELKYNQQKQNLSPFLHKISNKKNHLQDFTITNEYRNIQCNQIQRKEQQQQQKHNFKSTSPIQIIQKNLLINMRMSEARASQNIESILKYANDLMKEEIASGHKNNLQLPNKDYSSLQPRINQNQYKQNVQNRKFNSFGLKKNLQLFAENCKRRNQYIVSSIFKKNNLHSYN